MKENLFFRVESYAKENLITEALVYILETHQQLKDALLKLLLNNIDKNGELFKTFSNCIITTQSPYKESVIDVEFRSLSGKKILLEIKIDSFEGENQIQKYLDLNQGYVAYLTRLGQSEPSISKNQDRFLGRFFWEEVYKLIEEENTKKKNEIIDNFLKHLEGKNMNYPEPLLSEDFEQIKPAFKVLSKLRAIVSTVGNKIKPELENYFGTKTKGGTTINLYEENTIYQYFAFDKLKKSGISYIAIGIYFSEEKNEWCYYVSILFYMKIAKDLDFQLNSFFEERWKREDYGWYVKDFKLSPKDINKASEDFYSMTIEVIKEINGKLPQITSLITDKA